MEKIKLNPLPTVYIFNKLKELKPLSNDPVFTAWAHRLLAYMKPEVIMWNELTLDERKTILDDELEFPVQPIEAKHLPDVLVQDDIELLQLVTEGEIKPCESQIQKKLQSKINQKTHGKSKNVPAEQKAEASE